MIALDGTPAGDLVRSVELAEAALRALGRKRIGREQTADVAIAVYRLRQALDGLPRQIADGRTRFCAQCPHAALEIVCQPVGHGHAQQQVPGCATPELGECPAVNLAGFTHDSHRTLPTWLRRQAE